MRYIPPARDPDAVERKALSMRAASFINPIKVRPLSRAEKAADPRHDYELFGDALTLAGAELLGWPTLEAFYYEFTEIEALKHYSVDLHHSTPLTWVEVYGIVEKILADNPDSSAEQLAIRFQENPGEAKKVMRSLRLLNEASRKMIGESVHHCHEGRIDKGGYRFGQALAIPLARLEKAAPTLEEIQTLVQKTVETAIQYELYLEDLEELVDWTALGNDPEAFFAKEA